jgi:hypothetical protein
VSRENQNKIISTKAKLALSQKDLIIYPNTATPLIYFEMSNEARIRRNMLWEPSIPQLNVAT